MDRKIFRKKSLDRISSPEKIDDYLKVSAPIVWIVIVAMMLLLISAIVWCFYGSMPVTLSGVGLQKEKEVVCFVAASDKSKIKKGMRVRVESENFDEIIEGSVLSIGEPVLSEQAGKEIEEEWIVELLQNQWVCPVRISMEDTNLEIGTVCDVVFVLEDRKPIEFLIGEI